MKQVSNARVRPLLVLALALPVGAASGEEPSRAVERVNGEVSFSYVYSSLEQARERAGAGVLTLFSISSHEPELSARLTLPVGDYLGVRLAASASFVDVEVDDGADSDLAGGADGGAELFLRDPDIGYLEAGYRFSWFDFAFGGQSRSHAATAGAGIFFPDLGVGPLDWVAGFAYARERQEVPGFSSTTFDVYSVAVGPRWHLSDTLLASSAFSWRRVEQSQAEISRELAGSMQLDWLLGAPEGRYLSIGVFGGGGRQTTDFGGPFSNVDQDFWLVGGSVSVYVGPVRSFTQLLHSLQ